MFAEDQVIRYADVGGHSVAWSSVGSGPPLVVGGWWSSNLELDWTDPLFRRFVGVIAEHRTVVRYDRLGTGLSDRRAPVATTLDQELTTLTGVIEQLNAPQLALFGASSGGPVIGAFAALHPQQVSHLVMYGSYANGASIAPPAARDTLLATVDQHWGIGSRVLTDLFLPDATAEERAAYARFQRDSASKDVALTSLRTVFELDGSAYLDRIETPTLVLHRKNDTAIPFALGKDLASRIPGARFVELVGSNHFPWRGEADAVAAELLRFLGVPVAVASVSRSEPTGQLSEREREILRCVARGMTDQQIAAELFLSVHTVHRHVANIRSKLGVASRAAAASSATQQGLL